MRKIAVILSAVFIFAVTIWGCSPSSSSTTSSSASSNDEIVKLSKNGEANKFIEKWNKAYPENPITEDKVDNYKTGAGNAAEINIDDVTCEFSEADGNPTFSVLSSLPLDRDGRMKYLDQAAKVIAIQYGLSLSTAEEIMSEFRGEGKSEISYSFNGIRFCLMFDHYHNNYELFTYKSVY